MSLPVEADDHSGELIIRKDETALAVVAINAPFDGLECDVERHGALRSCRREHTSLSAASAWESLLTMWYNKQRRLLFGTISAQLGYSPVGSRGSA